MKKVPYSSSLALAEISYRQLALGGNRALKMEKEAHVLKRAKIRTIITCSNINNQTKKSIKKIEKHRGKKYSFKNVIFLYNGNKQKGKQNNNSNLYFLNAVLSSFLKKQKKINCYQIINLRTLEHFLIIHVRSQQKREGKRRKCFSNVIPKSFECITRFSSECFFQKSNKKLYKSLP